MKKDELDLSVELVEKENNRRNAEAMKKRTVQKITKNIKDREFKRLVSLTISVSKYGIISVLAYFMVANGMVDRMVAAIATAISISGISYNIGYFRAKGAKL